MPSIREYRSTDRPHVAQVWLDSWKATGLDPADQTSLADYDRRLAFDTAAWTIYVAVTDCDIAGFLAFQRPDTWLRQLFVAPSCQGQGIGRSLLNVAKQEMPQGFWLRTDAANAAARRFYERAGLILKEVGLHPVHGQPIATYAWKGLQTPTSVSSPAPT